jgi:SNF2 family DNA or RNA helicase
MVHPHLTLVKIEKQAIDRVVGKQKRVDVHRIVMAGSIDERILELHGRIAARDEGEPENGEFYVKEQRRGTQICGDDLKRMFRD